MLLKAYMGLLVKRLNDQIVRSAISVVRWDLEKEVAWLM
jgi:hypothetical protein